MRFPERPATPEEWRLLAWTAIVVFALIGMIGLTYSFFVPFDNVELTRRIQLRSFYFLGLSVSVYFAKRIAEHYLG